MSCSNSQQTKSTTNKVAVVEILVFRNFLRFIVTWTFFGSPPHRKTQADPEVDPRNWSVNCEGCSQQTASVILPFTSFVFKIAWLDWGSV